MKIVKKLYFNDAPTLRENVFRYLEDFPNIETKDLYKQFPKANKNTLRSYLNDFRLKYGPFNEIIGALKKVRFVMEKKMRFSLKLSLEEEEAIDIVDAFLNTADLISGGGKQV